MVRRAMGAVPRWESNMDERHDGGSGVPRRAWLVRELTSLRPTGMSGAQRPLGTQAINSAGGEALRNTPASRLTGAPAPMPILPPMVQTPSHTRSVLQ